MFLALEEMKRSKLRYSLILGLLFLISYLVFFLSGLSYGLMQENRAAVDKWEATSVYLSTNSNSTLAASRFDVALLDDVKAEDKAVLAQRAIVAWNKVDAGVDDKSRISVFGIHANEFIAPNIIEGHGLEASGQVVVDKTLIENEGYALGDTLYLADTDETYTIVGVTEQARFSVSPVVYMSFEDFQKAVYGERPESAPDFANAIVVRDENSSTTNEDLEKLSISDFIQNLPGYSAQNMTFGFMIGFLIVISSIVVSIFIYVLTTQKTKIFGLMKVQGLSNAFISKSVLAQTFLLSAVGTSLGLLGTYLSSLALPNAVPFQNNWPFYGAIFASLVVFAVLGAIFSVRAVVKVDPLKMIS
jgi:putative ABC transport system permease protein